MNGVFMRTVFCAYNILQSTCFCKIRSKAKGNHTANRSNRPPFFFSVSQIKSLFCTSHVKLDTSLSPLPVKTEIILQPLHVRTSTAPCSINPFTESFSGKLNDFKKNPVNSANFGQIRARFKDTHSQNEGNGVVGKNPCCASMRLRVWISSIYVKLNKHRNPNTALCIFNTITKAKVRQTSWTT